MKHENETFDCDECGKTLAWGCTITTCYPGKANFAIYYCENNDCDNQGIRKVT